MGNLGVEGDHPPKMCAGLAGTHHDPALREEVDRRADRALLEQIVARFVEHLQRARGVFHCVLGTDRDVLRTFGCLGRSWCMFGRSR